MIAVEIVEASDATVKLIGLPGAAPNRSSVTPEIAPATVLLALSIGTPSTVSDALAPATACVKPKAGSLMVKEGVGPPPVGTLLVMVRFVPFASLPAAAVTPRPSPLMAVANCA